MAQYHFPPIDLLSEGKDISKFTDRTYVQALGKNLSDLFLSFKLDASVIESNGYGYCILFKVKLGDGATTAIRKLKTEIEITLDGQPIEFLESANGKTITIAIKNLLVNLFQQPFCLFRISTIRFCNLF